MKTKYERHTLKLQRPLFGNGDPGEILIYNEDRSIEQLIPLNADELGHVFGDEPKVYFLADVPVNKPGLIKLIKRLPEQDW